MSELSKRARDLSIQYRQTHQGLSTDARSSHLLFQSSAVDVSIILDDYVRREPKLTIALEALENLAKCQAHRDEPGSIVARDALAKIRRV